MSFLLALSSVRATLGLVLIFFVLFPLLVKGLIIFALAQAAGERMENQEYANRDKP